MKYLGVDFGLKRVGLAQSEGQLASPWKVIEGWGMRDLLEKVRREANGFEKVVIGVPEGRMGRLVKKAAKLLRAGGLQVIEVDETLSTKKATVRMVELNIPPKKRRYNDAYSAALILQNHLDNL